MPKIFLGILLIIAWNTTLPAQDSASSWAGSPGDTVPPPNYHSGSISQSTNAAALAEQRLVGELDKRTNVYKNDIPILSDSVLLSFYDNGDIDDDTISVFLNKRPVIVQRGLTSRPLNIYIGLDSTREVHELSMFADNLGKFPPNTALMVISDGDIRYEVYLSSSLTQNASVRLRRIKR